LPKAKRGVAVGLVPHTGWTWLVRVAVADEGPRVESRVRIAACDVVDGELYHLAAERTRGQEPFLTQRRQAAVALAERALRLDVEGAETAVVLGKQKALPPLPRILAAHPLIHAAEGELWRAVFTEACAARGLYAVRSDVGVAATALAERYGSAAVRRFLAEGKRSVGAPWTREPQDAALAAWYALV
jgi:hypothetical protein